MTETKNQANEKFVRWFQSIAGVRVDGWAGAETRRAAERLLTDKKTQSDVDPILIADLKRDEGLRLNAYKDTVGVWTVGYGHAHVAPGTVWTQEQAEAALISDVKKHNAELEKALPWIVRLDPVRRRVLQNMAFNLGVKGFLGFKNTLAMVQSGDYAGAARGMLNSLWAKQVKGRAVRLAEQMRTGT